MDLSQTFATDVKLETEGVWKDLGEGAELKVARIGNPAYNKEMQRLMKPYKHLVSRGALSEDVAQKILIEAMAKTILVDWKGLKDGGKVIKYSTKAAIDMLTKYKDFRDLISTLAGEMTTFKVEADEAIEKN
jgi:hypothetical protein